MTRSIKSVWNKGLPRIKDECVAQPDAPPGLACLSIYTALATPGPVVLLASTAG